MWLVLFFSCILHLSQAQNPNIVVVEYGVFYTNHSHSDLTQNAANYVNEIKKFDKPDLIIFPESTIINSTESAVEVILNIFCNTTTCDNPLSMMSEVSKASNTYLVLNLVEKEKCADEDTSPNCQTTGFHYYNTDVAFNRNGVITHKYRKYNLFGEYDLDKPLEPEKVIIELDFGLKLGLITCFDILFKRPAIDLVNEVDGIIFPNKWFSELPFLSSLQVQQMFAQEHNVKLFASGANYPKTGTGGSGIYDGTKGTISNGINIEGDTTSFSFSNKSLYQDPKKFDDFFLKKDPSLDQFTSVPLDLTTDSIDQTVTFNSTISCHFKIQISKKALMENRKSYTYHMVAFSGIRSFDGFYFGGVEICGLIACLDSSVSSCGQRFPDYDQVQWPIIFESIEISADFEKSVNRIQYPSSLLSSIRPIEVPKTQWVSKETNEKVTRIFSTNEKQEELLTFGIYGRNFDLDFAPEVPTSTVVPNMVTTNKISFLILFISSLSLLY